MDLLECEKEMSRQRDELNAAHRWLPMVEDSRPYSFEGPDGPALLADLFHERRTHETPPSQLSRAPLLEA